MNPDGRPWRIAAMCFDHMHIGDQLQVILEHPEAELVGVFDTQPERMRRVCDDCGAPTRRLEIPSRAHNAPTNPAGSPPA